MSFDENKIYILNPAYIIRKDEYRVALYTKEGVNECSTPAWSSFIHPTQAMIFSFFTHQRSLKENVELISNFLNKNGEDVKRILRPFIENEMYLQGKWKDTSIYFPKNMLVNTDKLNEKYNFLEISPREFLRKQIELESKRHYRAPLDITIMLTNKCVTQCKYCYADTATCVKKTIETSRLLEIIKQASDLNMRHVNLIGGEVFLHPDWPIILKALVDHDLAPQYISTKVPITEKIIEQLKYTGYTNPVQISLDANSSDILEDSLMVNRNYLGLVKKGLSLLIEVT